MTDETISQPCEEWAERLATLEMDDLPRDERKALAGHVLVCPACRATLEDYRLIDDYLRRSSQMQHGAADPSRALKQWRKRMRAGTNSRHIWHWCLRWWNICYMRILPFCIPLLVGFCTFVAGARLSHVPGIDERMAFIITLAPTVSVSLIVVLFLYKLSRRAQARGSLLFFASGKAQAQSTAAERVGPPVDIVAEIASSSIAQFAQSLALDTLHGKRAWRDRSVLLIVVLSLIAAIIASLVVPFVSPRPAPPAAAALPLLSSGNNVFDPNRLDGDLKRQAAVKQSRGDIRGAISLWRQAVILDSNDAEALIYLEDDTIITAHQPYITLVVSTMLVKEHIGGGRDMLQGAYVAQRAYNDQAQHSGGRRLRLLIANTEFDERSAAQAAQQIVQLAKHDPSLLGVMGWPTSGSSLDALPILTAAHIPLVSPTASSDALSGRSPYFFRIAPTDREQASVAAEYARDILHAHTVELFIDTSNSYSQSLGRAFTQHFADVTHKIILEHYTRGQVASLEQGIHDIDRQKPDLIYFAGYVSDASIVLKNLPACQVPNAPNCLKMMGGDALYVQGDYSLEAFASYDRLLFTAFAFPDEWGAQQQPAFFQAYTQDFDPHQQYQERYGYSLPDADAILAYDATQVLLHAADQLSHSHSRPSDLQRALLTLTGAHALQGVSGPLAFGADGDALNKPVLILAGTTNGTTRMQAITQHLLLRP